MTPRLAFTFVVLVGINTVNFYDRQVLGAVQEQLRKEWGLSDSRLGMLGTAFILLYAVVGLPLGRLADRWRRAWILAAGVGLWSLTTFASGLATGFWMLFGLRLLVGVGEASCAPAASSLIGDLVPAERRARVHARASWRAQRSFRRTSRCEGERCSERRDRRTNELPHQRRRGRRVLRSVAAVRRASERSSRREGTQGPPDGVGIHRDVRGVRRRGRVGIVPSQAARASTSREPDARR